MAITLTISGLDEVKRLFADLKDTSSSRFSKVLMEAAVDVQTAAKENVAVDTGLLRSEIIVESVDEGLGAEIGTNNTYGKYIEFGTSPHFPPVAPLEEWAQRHGLPEGTGFAIAKRISERGTPERPWLFPAYELVVGNIPDRIKEEFIAMANEAAARYHRNL